MPLINRELTLRLTSVLNSLREYRHKGRRGATSVLSKQLLDSLTPPLRPVPGLPYYGRPSAITPTNPLVGCYRPLWYSTKDDIFERVIFIG